MAPSPLDERYAAVVKRVRARVVDYLTTEFARSGSYRDRDLQRFVGLAVPVVIAGQRQVSALTDAYLAQVLTTTLGRPVRPSGAVNDYPRPTAPTEVYARPYVTVRTKLSEGSKFPEAVSAGVARLVDIAATDLQLAKTHTARQSFTRNNVQRYRRVLTGSVSCALCYVASTQTYSRGDLLPIHPGCDCSVAPVVGTFDRDAELEATHEAIKARLSEADRGARAPDYRKQLIVQEHGDMGPVLAVRGQHFQGRSVMDN
jgi:hypothetical protein